MDASQITQDFILREISQTLSQRKKLHVQVSRLENELTSLEKSYTDPVVCTPAVGTTSTTSSVTKVVSNVLGRVTSDRVAPHSLPPSDRGSTAAAIAERVSAITGHDRVLGIAGGERGSNERISSMAGGERVATIAGGSTVVLTTAPPSAAEKSPGSHSAAVAASKSRHRSRNQEWPAVPDVGKIEEKNPELLAMKILETGRQIEAGRIPVLPPGEFRFLFSTVSNMSSQINSKFSLYFCKEY